MEIYDSEQEQIDALKKWWRENGKTTIVGVVLGLGGVLGWTSWQNYVAQQNSRASGMFTQVMNDAAQQAAPKVSEQSEQLVRDFPDSGYAAYAKLIAAASAYQANDATAAKADLKWVIEHASRPAVRDIARLRTAKILAEEKAFDAATAMLDAIATPDLAPIVLEVRGDMLVSKQNNEQAAEAYRKALADTDLAAQSRRRIQLKMDDLGISTSGNGV